MSSKSTNFQAPLKQHQLSLSNAMFNNCPRHQCDVTSLELTRKPSFPFDDFKTNVKIWEYLAQRKRLCRIRQDRQNNKSNMGRCGKILYKLIVFNMAATLMKRHRLSLG
jgi:hypothetical protein